MQDYVNQRNWQNQFDYQKEQDALAQNNWQQQFDYGKEQDALAQNNWQQQFDYGKQQDSRDYNLKNSSLSMTNIWTLSRLRAIQPLRRLRQAGAGQAVLRPGAAENRLLQNQRQPVSL